MKKSKVQNHTEFEVMSGLNHPNILHALDVMINEQVAVIVMPVMNHQSLHNLVYGRGGQSENVAREWMRQILSGLNHLHKRRICHCDLKPENIMAHVDDTDLTGETMLRIGDFGAAYSLPVGEKIPANRGMCTYQYRSYEQVSGLDFGLESDIWSSGAIMYEILTGNRLFDGPSREVVFNKIIKGFQPENMKLVGDDAVDLLQKLLHSNPKERISALDALSHPWLD